MRNWMLDLNIPRVSNGPEESNNVFALRVTLDCLVRIARSVTCVETAAAAENLNVWLVSATGTRPLATSTI